MSFQLMYSGEKGGILIVIPSKFNKHLIKIRCNGGIDRRLCMSQARGTFILNTEPLKAIDNYSINLKNISILIPINGICSQS
jgi:hypothetical protein